MDKLSAQVIIIGAGIAGLTAAWKLKKAGIQTLILEADKVVGGRMQSIHIEDALIDYGAQFLSSAYSIIPNLINEVGLNKEFVETSNWVGLIRNKDITLIQTQKSWSLFSNHILSFWSWLRLGFNQIKLFNLKKKSLSLNDITYWISYDKELASEWLIRHFGKEVACELIATIFNGFYFQSINNSSAAMAAAVLAFSTYRPKTMTLISGMRSLPQKLADNLNVKTNVLVSSINQTTTGIKIISDSGEEFFAEHVIVTPPAPIAKSLIQNPDQWTLKLFATNYSSSIIISLLTDANWYPPANINSAYGFLLNPQLDSKLAALTIENNKHPSRKKHGFLVNIMLSDKYAKRFMDLSDEDINAEIKSDVEKIFPALYSHLYMKKIFRWKYAMPCTPIDRASAVKAYRDTRSDANRIWLAGDYLGLPWTDSAAQTGLWAANQILRHY